jgi:hypothetical protein
LTGSTASGGASCRLCHGNTIGPGSVQILGFPTQYQPNLLYSLSVRVADPTKLGAGFQFDVETFTGQPAGTILRTDLTHTQLNSRSSPTLWLGINHTSSGVNNSVANWASMGNAAVYNLSWRAPSSDVGPVRAWAVGNAINNSFTSSGDIIYLTNRTATFTFATGACCDETNGACTENVLPDGCQAPVNRYGGDGSTCATIDPPCSIAPSGCCDGATGSCMDGLSEAECAGLGDQTVYSPYIPCSRLGAPGYPPACMRHSGACCDHSPGAGGPDGDGVCTDGNYPEDCAGTQQTWHKGLLCVDIECLEASGACCNTLTGNCTEDSVAGECDGAQRQWTKGASCSDVSCDATPGACCDRDTFGGCTSSTYAACTCDTCEWHKLVTCAEISCLHNPIPTVSEWGLLVITLSLLIGAKVYFGQRSETESS